MEFNPKMWPNKVLIPVIIAVSLVGGFFIRDISGINVFEVSEPKYTEF